MCYSPRSRIGNYNRFLDPREFLTLQYLQLCETSFSIFLIKKRKKERKENMGIEKVEIIV